MGNKSSSQAVEPAPQPTGFPPRLVKSMHGQKTVTIKGVWITDDPQQNQQDGEVVGQAGDDQRTTAQPS